jgi:hypothetical protein
MAPSLLLSSRYLQIIRTLLGVGQNPIDRRDADPNRLAISDRCNPSSASLSTSAARDPVGLRYGLFHLSKALVRRKSGVPDCLAVPLGRDKEGALNFSSRRQEANLTPCLSRFFAGIFLSTFDRGAGRRSGSRPGDRVASKPHTPWPLYRPGPPYSPQSKPDTFFMTITVADWLFII